MLIPSKLFLAPFRFQKYQNGLQRANSCDKDFTQVDNLRDDSVHRRKGYQLTSDVGLTVLHFILS